MNKELVLGWLCGIAVVVVVVLLLTVGCDRYLSSEILDYKYTQLNERLQKEPELMPLVKEAMRDGTISEREFNAVLFSTSTSQLRVKAAKERLQERLQERLSPDKAEKAQK